ncbi:MAG: PKD domain-containing protein [Paludibacteraceae bacterium]|nr:PKD domain-containing protein [Paludibacteraceae bacterium]
MKKIYILLTICCALIACKKNNVDFSFSPDKPRAGETVYFSNLSDSGEDWEWTFGDGATSSLKSPSHVYKRPGDYVVVLKVDKKNAWTKTAKVTVYDTVPTFVASDTVFYIYKDYTFTANVYNPYNYDVNLEWDIEEQDTLVKFIDKGIVCYFTQPEDSALIKLRIILNGETTDVQKKFYIQDRKTNSLLLRTADADYRQRIFGERAEQYKKDETAKQLLDLAQDTAQIYNGSEFRLSELKTIFPELQGFRIASRKIYYRAEGLWVANIDGANPVQIDDAECFAMTLDTKDSRIYWANADGVWYMPFVGSDNNKFVTTPTLLNTLQNVTKLAADNEPK